jgi:hypothetical protein
MPGWERRSSEIARGNSKDELRNECENVTRPHARAYTPFSRLNSATARPDATSATHLGRHLRPHPTPRCVYVLPNPSWPLQQLQQTGHITTCVISDLLLKHPDATLMAYV